MRKKIQAAPKSCLRSDKKQAPQMERLFSSIAFPDFLRPPLRGFLHGLAYDWLKGLNLFLILHNI